MQDGHYFRLTMAGSSAPSLAPVDPNQVYALIQSCADQSDYVRYQRDQKSLTELFAHPGESDRLSSCAALICRMLPRLTGNSRKQISSEGRKIAGIDHHGEGAENQVEKQNVSMIRNPTDYPDLFPKLGSRRLESASSASWTSLTWL